MPNEVIEALKTKLQDIGEVKAVKKIETAEKIAAAGPEFYNTVEVAAVMAVAGLPDEEKSKWLQFAKVIIGVGLMDFLVTD